MHIEYLKYFKDVASMGSISKVANKCHISQPALSQQIQRLEDTLGHKLFIRSNKGIELTNAGLVVDKYAKNIIKAYEKMVDDLNSLHAKNKTVRIDCNSVLATYVLPCAIYKIEEKYPSFKLELNTNHSEEVESNIANDIYEVGFMISKPKESGILYDKVGTDRVIPVVANRYKINDDINLQDLLEHRLIMLNNKCNFRNQIEENLKNQDFKFDNKIFELDTIESVKSTVIKGYGISFLPYISIKKELYTKQLKKLNVLDFKMNFDIYIIYKKETYNMNENVREFIQLFKKIGPKTFC